LTFDLASQAGKFLKDLAKIEGICYAAEQLTPEARELFLREACGADDELRREVESLLAFAAQAENFIETPPHDIAAAAMFTKHAHQNLVGRKLNHYKILSPLGAGGMGEVYLAEDRKLGRKVALKLLPSQFSQDAERIGRFEREARAASALNHPNIITIHAIEEAEDLTFIATELVDGKTLRERIAEKPFDPPETIEIGIQVASALESAHAVGIIHRDIKPANIMIRRDSLVKVLDFGLAKLLEESSGTDTELWKYEEANALIPASFERTNSPAPPRQTNLGAIMGTLNYMSPEQVKGEKIDARTDIFSLGVVLYEMLSGTPPFAGKTDEEIYAATIGKAPKPLRELNSKIPFELQKIINRALHKDRNGRYQTVSALCNDLRKLQQPKKAKVFRWLIPSVAVLSAIFVGSYLYFSPNRPANPFQTIKLDRLTANGLTITEAISPDGKYVVYAKKENEKQSLWRKQTDNLSETRIAAAGLMQYDSLKFAPDGESLYFVGTEKVGDKSSLYQMSLDGTNQRKLIEGVNSEISFSPDAQKIAFVRDKDGEDDLIIADAPGGNERILNVRKYPNTYTEGVSWSRDGKLIAVAILKRRTNYGAGLAVVDAASGVETSLQLSEPVIRVSSVVWSKDGKGLLFSRFFSPTGMRYQLHYAAYPSGKIQYITNDLASYENLSVTADGKTMVATQREYSMGIWLTDAGDFTKAAEIQTKTGRDDGGFGISWTKDGNKIVYVSSEGEAQNIWRIETGGANQKPLTSGTEYGKLYPSLNNDNGLITFFAVHDKGKFDFFQMDSDGQNVRQATNFGTVEINGSANKDWIVCEAQVEGKSRVWKTPAGGGEPVRLSDVDSKSPTLSPDGKFVAYVETVTGQPNKIEIISIDGGQPLKSYELPVTADIKPGIEWSRDGSSILFVNTLGIASNIWQQPTDGKPANPLTDFKEFQIAAFAQNSEGTRLAISRGSRNRDAVLVRSVP
jgi:serine/threonine protein kinase